MQRSTISTGTLTPLSLSSYSNPPGDSLHTPLLFTLPSDLVEEILFILPVKYLLRLRCVCKSLKSLISDPKFVRKHARMSAMCHSRHHLIVSSMNSSSELFLLDSPISSVFSAFSQIPQFLLATQKRLNYPKTMNNGNPSTLDDRYGADLGVSYCDGILCSAIDQSFLCFDKGQSFALLWNPSLRKFKILPPLENPRRRIHHTLYSFGYDHFIGNYKIVAVSFCHNKNEVSVLTLGTDTWRTIQDFPYCGPIYGPGIFVSGTVNWLAYEGLTSSSRAIVSLDLAKESYRTILHPDFEKDLWTLGEFRGCLCIFANSSKFFYVWVMKEYGNKESWTKLFSVPYRSDLGVYSYTKAVYISEDDQVMLCYKKLMKRQLVVYNSRNSTFNVPKIEKIECCIVPEVYAESLVSPC